MNVADKTIQRILRHGNVFTTMTHYVKPVGQDVEAAMKVLEDAVHQYAPDGRESAPDVVVN